MITKRTLENWRKDALACKNNPLMQVSKTDVDKVSIAEIKELEYCDRILRLTQELIDFQLMKKG